MRQGGLDELVNMATFDTKKRKRDEEMDVEPSHHRHNHYELIQERALETLEILSRNVEFKVSLVHQPRMLPMTFSGICAGNVWALNILSNLCMEGESRDFLEIFCFFFHVIIYFTCFLLPPLHLMF